MERTQSMGELMLADSQKNDNVSVALNLQQIKPFCRTSHKKRQIPDGWWRFEHIDISRMPKIISHQKHFLLMIYEIKLVFKIQIFIQVNHLCFNPKTVICLYNLISFPKRRSLGISLVKSSTNLSTYFFSFAGGVGGRNSGVCSSTSTWRCAWEEKKILWA